MKRNPYPVITALLTFCLLLCVSRLAAGTTGKIVGTLVDGSTKEPLIGADVLLVGTSIGSSTDENGNYMIINVPPGIYSVRASMIGYKTLITEHVKLSVDMTTTLNAELESTVIEAGEVVTVVAERALVQKDMTSSLSSVSADEIEDLPVQSIEDVLELQAGVVRTGGQIHIRGGRSSEIAYWVDGVSTTDVFNGSSGVTVENSAIQELQVVSGTFNAEYGNAMSGVVNMVTKDGGDEYHGYVRGYVGNYYSAHNDIFLGIDKADIARITDIQVNLDGPIIKNKLGFLINYRNEQGNNGPQAGYRRFMPYDYNSNFNPTDPVTGNRIFFYSGDNQKVNMQWSQNTKVWGKLTYRLSNIKFAAQANWDIGNSRGYNHQLKYRPDGRSTGYYDNRYYMFQVNAPIGKSAFAEASASFTDNYYTSYLYEDPEDLRYLPPDYSYNGDSGFITGGNDLGYNQNILQNFTFKLDFNWQINKIHSVKTGYLYNK